MLSDATRFDWDDLKIFLAIARAGSIRQAAEGIHFNHATLSRRLSTMESRLGARLFDRATTGLSLTQLGENLMPHAIRVEDEMLAVARQVMGADARPSGPIYVSLPNWFALTTVMDDLDAFSRAHPDVQLILSFRDDFADLLRREADVSLRVASEVTENVVGRRLVEMSWAAYGNARTVGATRDDHGAQQHFLGWTDAGTDQALLQTLKRNYPNGKIRHRVSDLAGMTAAIAAGLGVGFLPCNVGDRYPDLARVPFQEPFTYQSIWLLLHGDLRDTARVRLFVDDLSARIRSHRALFLVAGSKKQT